MAALYQCDFCKKTFPLDEITEVTVAQTRVPLLQFDLCDDDLSKFTKDLEEKTGARPLKGGE